MSKHTAEPWTVMDIHSGEYQIGAAGQTLDYEGQEIALCRIIVSNWDGEPPREQIAANAHRIANCVNGCRGIPSPETTVPKLVEAARKAETLLGVLLDLYGRGLKVANWHQNGDTEPLDNFIDDNRDGDELELLREALAGIKEEPCDESN